MAFCEQITFVSFRKGDALPVHNPVLKLWHQIAFRQLGEYIPFCSHFLQFSLMLHFKFEIYEFIYKLINDIDIIINHEVIN